MITQSEKTLAPTPPNAVHGRELAGMLYGLVGVAIFSLTLPLTRYASAQLTPFFIATGRAVVATVIAGLFLRLRGAKWPRREYWPSLAWVALGCVLGFPLFSSLAMGQVAASHGAIVLGILPLMTALAGSLRAGERPSKAFWLCAALGSAIVIGFAMRAGLGGVTLADAYLLAAVVCAAFGYAEGARLARYLNGLEVIAWALVFALPVMGPLTAWAMLGLKQPVSILSWAAFSYVSLGSMFLGFYFWYKGLAMGGIARVGQVQLLQPFLSLLAAFSLLGESVGWQEPLYALAIVGTVAMGRRMPIARANEPAPRK